MQNLADLHVCKHHLNVSHLFCFTFCSMFTLLCSCFLDVAFNSFSALFFFELLSYFVYKRKHNPEIVDVLLHYTGKNVWLDQTHLQFVVLKTSNLIIRPDSTRHPSGPRLEVDSFNQMLASSQMSEPKCQINSNVDIDTRTICQC